MQTIRQHYFVCTNARPPFAKASCAPKDSTLLLALLKEEVEKRGLQDEIKVTGCGCLGPCDEGPVMVVYPQGIWYQKVTPEDVPEIVEQHMLQNKPVERLLLNMESPA